MSHKGIKTRLLEKAVGRVDERILEYIIKNFDEVTFMSAEKLCYAADCTAEELKALCAAFGAESLLALMAVLREAVYSEMDDVHSTHDRELRDITDMVMRYEMDNITDYVSKLDTALVDRLARDLSAATEVYIVGVRSTAPMAVYAAHILSAAGIRTRKLDVAENYVDGVVNMDRGGLVLAMDFIRYHKGTLVLLNMLKKNGFKIVSITDSPDAPVARVSDYSICVPRRSHDYTDSFVTSTMLLNTLAIYIGMQDKGALIRRLHQYDETTQRLEFYF